MNRGVFRVSWLAGPKLHIAPNLDRFPNHGLQPVLSAFVHIYKVDGAVKQNELPPPRPPAHPSSTAATLVSLPSVPADTGPVQSRCSFFSCLYVLPFIYASSSSCSLSPFSPLFSYPRNEKTEVPTACASLTNPDRETCMGETGGGVITSSPVKPDGDGGGGGLSSRHTYTFQHVTKHTHN